MEKKGNGEVAAEFDHIHVKPTFLESKQGESIGADHEGSQLATTKCEVGR
jgi:hypothetical protein